MPRFLALASLVVLAACGSSRPLSGDGGADADVSDGGPPATCVVDGDCDDGIACTDDACVAGLCIHQPDHSVCVDDSFCNGVERCDVRLGCVPGPLETCDDGDACTVDRCDEASASCRHFERDLDRDGDVDLFCGGGDCDDAEPTVSSRSAERCGNRRDDDCDGEVDEAGCAAAPHDTCADPLDVSPGGTFVVAAPGLRGDYLGCGIIECRDFVARFTLDEPRDVTIVADADEVTTYTALALRTVCDDPSSELEGATGFPATLRRRALPAGTYYVLAGGEGQLGGAELDAIVLDVTFGPPSPTPDHETCASPLDVSGGGTFTADFVDTRDDLELGCGGGGGGHPELVHVLTLSERADLRITLDGLARLGLSVRTACDDAGSALRCVVLEPWQNRVQTFRDLPAGTYYLVLELRSTPEVQAELAIEVLPPSAPPLGETCESAIPLAPGTRVSGSLAGFEDDVDGPGFCNDAREAVYVLELDEPSDVWALATGARDLGITVRDGCGRDASARCGAGGDPERGHRAGASAQGLVAGTYYVTVEGERGESFVLEVAAWPARTGAPARVTGNDRCEDAVLVPPEGGRFAGTTSGARDDYEATRCSVRGTRDVAFRIELGERRRLVASTEGSAISTALQLRGSSCGTDAELACDVGSGGSSGELSSPSASVIDRVLEPGTYHLVVEGDQPTATGEYVLDVALLDWAP